MILFQVIANVFFHGGLSTVFHIVVTIMIIAVVTGVSLVYDCLGIVLELNVSESVYSSI